MSLTFPAIRDVIGNGAGKAHSVVSAGGALLNFNRRMLVVVATLILVGGFATAFAALLMRVNVIKAPVISDHTVVAEVVSIRPYTTRGMIMAGKTPIFTTNLLCEVIADYDGGRVNFTIGGQCQGVQLGASYYVRITYRAFLGMEWWDIGWGQPPAN